MSNHQNEVITETKFEIYKEYLEGLSREFLLCEFNDRMGCDPVDFYTAAIRWENPECWMGTLLDAYAYTLYCNPEAYWSTSIKGAKR